MPEREAALVQHLGLAGPGEGHDVEAAQPRLAAAQGVEFLDRRIVAAGHQHGRRGDSALRPQYVAFEVDVLPGNAHGLDRERQRGQRRAEGIAAAAPGGQQGSALGITPGEEIGAAEIFAGAQPRLASVMVVASRVFGAGARRFGAAFGEPLRVPAAGVARRDAAGNGQDLAEVGGAAGRLGGGALQLRVELGVVEEQFHGRCRTLVRRLFALSDDGNTRALVPRATTRRRVKTVTLGSLFQRHSRANRGQA